MWQVHSRTGRVIAQEYKNTITAVYKESAMPARLRSGDLQGKQEHPQRGYLEVSVEHPFF